MDSSPTSRSVQTSSSTAQGRRVRVLHVVQNLNYGGMERLLADIVLRVAPAEFESEVLVLQYLGRFAEDLRSTTTIHQVSSMPGFSMIHPRSLVHAIRSIDPDVVHSHSGVWYKTSLAARRAGVGRVIHTEHGRQMPDPFLARFLDGLASRRTDVAVAVSESVASLLRRRVVRGTCRVEVILNGIDTDLYSPRPDTGGVRHELGIPHSAPIIGSIGRLEPVKDFRTMIDAFHALAAHAGLDPTPYLVIAGDGSEHTALQRRVDELGLAKHVRLLGWRDDTRDLLACFSLFTMSSLSEGTSVSLLEAMSSGLCPVVTEVGGSGEVLGPHLHHRLVPPGNAKALSLAWARALSDGTARRRDALTARARVSESYSLENMVRGYEALYAPRDA